MEKLDYYMGLPYKVEIIPAEEGGYVARIPELPGCITQAETFEEIAGMIQDAKKCWLESVLERGLDVPEPARDENYSGKFNIRMPKSLHRQLAMRAKEEAVSLNALATTLIAQGLGRRQG